MSLTIRIDTSSKKAKAFVNFIKTLDFVYIHENENKEVTDITNAEKKAIDKGIKSLDEGLVLPHEQVMDRLKMRHPKYFAK